MINSRLVVALNLTGARVELRSFCLLHRPVLDSQYARNASARVSSPGRQRDRAQSLSFSRISRTTSSTVSIVAVSRGKQTCFFFMDTHERKHDKEYVEPPYSTHPSIKWCVYKVRGACTKWCAYKVRSLYFEWCVYKVMLQYALRFPASDFLVMIPNYTPTLTVPAF